MQLYYIMSVVTKLAIASLNLLMSPRYSETEDRYYPHMIIYTQKKSSYNAADNSIITIILREDRKYYIDIESGYINYGNMLDNLGLNDVVDFIRSLKNETIVLIQLMNWLDPSRTDWKKPITIYKCINFVDSDCDDIDVFPRYWLHLPQENEDPDE